MRLENILIFILLTLGCEETRQSADPLLPELSITGIFPDRILEGTLIKIEGEGFIKKNLGEMYVTFTGDQDGEKISFTVQPAVLSQQLMHIAVSSEFIAKMHLDGGFFYGEVIVERILFSGTKTSSGLYAEIQPVSNLNPSVLSVSPLVTYPGETISITGENFLMNNEGVSLIKLNGVLTVKNGYTTKEIKNIYLPGHADIRNKIQAVLTPDILGIEPAVFHGSVTVINSTDISQMPGNELADISLEIDRTFIEKIYPDKVRRGQKLVFEGRGFLPADASLETLTLITFEGDYVPDGMGSVVFTDKNPLILFSEKVESNQIYEYVLRVRNDPDSKNTGLGYVPAHLSGVWTPWIIYSEKIEKGFSIKKEIVIQPQLQVVYIKYLPGFENALEKFGLGEMSSMIKERILEVVKNDYNEISIDFRTEKPEDFIEYSKIDVGGTDPNKAGLLGLDNTSGKDTGNLVFDDVIGGYNAESEEEGYFAYGGVFVESILMFSQTLMEVPAELASAAFDEIFSPFLPQLGGIPVKSGEYPGSARDEAIAGASKTLGNLIADTITHEIGHSLGLASDQGEFHNIGDNPGWIMDAGTYRPFEERSQLPGAYKRIFAPHDLNYLKKILPKD